MEAIASIIGRGTYVFIGMVSVLTALGFAYVFREIRALDNEMKSGRKVKKDYTPGGIKKIIDPETWGEVLEYLERFNKIEIRYASIEQLIPVFPLLGILGTVAGLIGQLGDVEQMRAAMAISMWTTFWGLMAAIAFKCIDAFVVSPTVNKMQLYFETYEQSYNMLRDKHFSENETGSR